jgi:hypothetical protein
MTQRRDGQRGRLRVLGNLEGQRPRSMSRGCQAVRVGGSGVRAPGAVEVRRRFGMAPATAAFAMCGGAGFGKKRCFIRETGGGGSLISRVVRRGVF